MKRFLSIVLIAGLFSFSNGCSSSENTMVKPIDPAAEKKANENYQNVMKEQMKKKGKTK